MRNLQGLSEWGNVRRLRLELCASEGGVRDALEDVANGTVVLVEAIRAGRLGTRCYAWFVVAAMTHAAPRPFDSPEWIGLSGAVRQRMAACGCACAA